MGKFDFNDIHRCEILGDHQNPSISQISVKHLQVCVLRIDSGPLAGSGAS